MKVGQPRQARIEFHGAHPLRARTRCAQNRSCEVVIKAVGSGHERSVRATSVPEIRDPPLERHVVVLCRGRDRPAFVRFNHNRLRRPGAHPTSITEEPRHKVGPLVGSECPHAKRRRDSRADQRGAPDRRTGTRTRREQPRANWSIDLLCENSHHPRSEALSRALQSRATKDPG